MSIIDYIKEKISCFILTLIYLIYTIIYLIKLDKLNNELKSFTSTGVQNAIDVVKYQDGIAIQYFMEAFILVLIGIILIIYVLFSRYELNFYLLLIYMFILVVCIVLIILFINNPILKSILIVTCGIGGVFFAYTN